MSLALVPRFGSRPVFVTVAHADGPVSVCVSVHDAYHLRTRASWRRRILTAGGDRDTVARYRRWQADERAWYAAIELTPPGLTRHRRSGRRRGRLCHLGHPLTRVGQRQVCRPCIRRRFERRAA